MKLGVVIYTYNKIEEACIQMEIIRELRTPHFQEIKIVHTYNGPRENYTQKYLEDDLLYLENPGHYEGAANLMDAGIEQVLKYDIDMIAINASDCRWIDPLKIKKILEKMRKEEKFLGSCPWSISANHEWRGVGIACDTFFLDARRERENQVFPLKWKEFEQKYIDLIRYIGKNNVLVEALLASRYISACNRVNQGATMGFYANEKIYFIEERIPTLLSHVERNFNIPSLGLYTDHDINIKKQILKKNNLNLGKYSNQRISEI